MNFSGFSVTLRFTSLCFPALGVIAEVFQTFAKRPVFSRTVFIVEFAAVTFLSVGVWMHHMFTTGVNYSVLQTFSFTTLAISIPFEGVVLGLVLTLYKGHIKLNTPMLYSLAAIFTVTLGGITGVLQAFPVLDYAFNGTYWIVGHFHYVMAGTTLFALIAGLYYWWPKITKRTPNETFGVIIFIVSFVGFNILYFPYFFMLDMPRRISTFSVSLGISIVEFNGNYRRVHIRTCRSFGCLKPRFKFEKTPFFRT